MSTPSTVGPYRILDRLGRGGMGVVFRAQNQETGELVALKTLQEAGAAVLESMRTEIHALSRLSHPGVVRIVAEGVHEGFPWYAMELLTGPTLGEFAAQVRGIARTVRLHPSRHGGGWWTRSLGGAEPAVPKHGRRRGRGREWSQRPEELRAILTIVRRLCAPLAFLHGEGIVHRDLKPENVLVRESGMPVIIDFGLTAQWAGRTSREPLQAEGDAAGTVAYIAPEQGRGELCDARADLYALGCILYELVVGRQPFVGETPNQVFQMRYELDPEPPSRLVKGIPRALEELILRLLERDPRRRLGHADDVAVALAALGAEDGLATAGASPRAYLYRPGFFGRDESLSTLVPRLELLGEGRGGLVLVGGESGVGKTRLLMALGARASEMRIWVLSGECATESPAPLQAFRKPLRAIGDRCRERGGAETERVLGARGKVLARYVPEIRDLPGLAESEEPAELPPDAARSRVMSFLAGTLRAASEERPLLVLLDDLQWADDLTLELLKFLLRGGALERMPVLIVGSYRSEEVSGQLGELLADSASLAVSLGRLPEEAVGHMVAEMLAVEEPPAGFVEFLARQSEGNPFFVAEYCRTALSEGILHRDREGRWQIAAQGRAKEAYEELPLPGSVKELVARRIDGLDGAAAELLRLASVMGREVQTKLLAAGVGETQAMEGIAALMAKQVMEQEPPSRLRFVHDKIREVAYERLDIEERRALHGVAAEAIQALHGEDEEWLAELGRHFDAAGQSQRARACYLPAARRAARGFALREAERLYRAFLALGGDEVDALDAHNELAETVMRLQGRLLEAAMEHERALVLARALPDRRGEAAALSALGMVKRQLGEVVDARSLQQTALAIARELCDRVTEGRILGSLANIELDEGRNQEALDLYGQALSAHRLGGNRRMEARTISNLGVLAYRQGQLERARELFGEALAMHREQGERADEAHVQGLMALVLDQLGHVEEARRLHEEVLKSHRQIGNRREEALTLGNLAGVSHQQGRLRDARELYGSAIAILKEVGDRRSEALFTINLATTLRIEGRSQEARALFERSLGIAKAVGDPASQAWALGGLGRVELDLGRIGEARVLCDRALSLVRAIGDRRLEGLILLMFASVERLAGDASAALLLVVDAESLMREAESRHGLAESQVERGHIALSRSEDALPFLAEARALASELGVPSECPLMDSIAALERAIGAAASGQRLFRGDLPEEVPEALRKHLTDARDVK